MSKNDEHPDPTNATIEVTGTCSVLSNNNIGPDSTNSSVTVHSSPKKRYMIIDETELPSEEAERLLAKRAYNRQCAERARKRSKQNVQELLRQVQELYADKEELRRSLATKEKEMQLLQNKNRMLLQMMSRQEVDIHAHQNSIGVTEQHLLSLQRWRGDRIDFCSQDISASLLPSSTSYHA